MLAWTLPSVVLWECEQGRSFGIGAVDRCTCCYFCSFLLYASVLFPVFVTSLVGTRQDFCLKSIQRFRWTFSSCRTLKKTNNNNNSGSHTHTQIPHQGHNKGPPRSCLSFHFYLCTRAPLRPNPVFITNSVGGKIRGDIPTTRAMSAPYTQNSEAEQRQNKASCNGASKTVLYFYFYYQMHASGRQKNRELIIVCNTTVCWYTTNIEVKGCCDVASMLLNYPDVAALKCVPP